MQPRVVLGGELLPSVFGRSIEIFGEIGDREVVWRLGNGESSGLEIWMSYSHLCWLAVEVPNEIVDWKKGIWRLNL